MDLRTGPRDRCQLGTAAYGISGLAGAHHSLDPVSEVLGGYMAIGARKLVQVRAMAVTETQ